MWKEVKLWLYQRIYMDVKLGQWIEVIKGRSKQQRRDFWRHVGGYARRDELSNLSIRSELRKFNINDKIKDKKNKWHDHIQRMNLYRIARKAVGYKPLGHRDFGRPKRRWVLKFPIWSERILWSTMKLMMMIMMMEGSSRYRICLEGLRKSKKIFNQDSMCLGRDLNLESP
jgi:hypothetical protein